MQDDLSAASSAYSELWAAQNRLVEARSEAASLKRKLISAEICSTAQRRALARPSRSAAVSHLHNERRDELRTRLEHENAALAKLAATLAGNAEAVAASRQERHKLREELRAATGLAVVRGASSVELRARLSAARRVAEVHQGELLALAAAHERLEARKAALQQEVVSEWATTRALREKLDGQGRALTWLRTSARRHGEELRGAVQELDQHVQDTASQPEIDKHKAACDSGS
mmetsp:Transcript_63562/g.206551  ORF Transcript_63562/g.206551 Transcript_63562/m.206551 type:complete len:232 (+) Transcript_63562:83-778(+)